MTSRQSQLGPPEDWLSVQTTLGCQGCHYSDARWYGKGPCCQYMGRLETNTAGRCMVRRDRAPAIVQWGVK